MASLSELRKRAGLTRSASPKSAPVDMEQLRPVLAGARARGMSDAFELTGTAAVMVDASGTVLHATQPTNAYLGGLVNITSRHLVATDREGNEQVQKLLAKALRLESSQKETFVELRGPGGGAGGRLTALTIPDAESDPCQLLKAIIIIKELV